MPPFQLAAMTFSIGALVGITWLAAGGAGAELRAALARLGARGRRPVRLPRALLHRASRRAAGRGGADRLSVAALIVSSPRCFRASGCAGSILRAPRSGFAGTALIVAAAAARVRGAARGRLSRRARLRPHMGRLFDPVAALSRRARPASSPATASPRPSSAPSSTRCSSRRSGRRRRRNGWRSSASGYAGRRRLLCLGRRRQARRHPGARRGELLRAAAVHPLLIVAGFGAPTAEIAVAALLITGGALSLPRGTCCQACGAGRRPGPQTCRLTGMMGLDALEPVLARPHLGEDPRRVRARHADGALNGRIVGAQEWVGGLLARDRGGQRQAVLGPQPLDLPQPLGKRPVLGIDRDGEARVRQRVFVPAIDERVVGKGAQRSEASPTSSPACPRRRARSPWRTGCRR